MNTNNNSKKELNKKMKGYAFDSLVFRYKIAREAQMRAEQLEYKKTGEINKVENAKHLAERDLMRFIQILDEAIGEHY